MIAVSHDGRLLGIGTIMINYRVEGIDELVVRLRSGGVTITDSITTDEYGKFVDVPDLEGSTVELWEPVDEGFAKMYACKTVH